MDRPSFDEVYMNLAVMLAKRSTCARLGVGCVIASEDNQRVLSLGYNGNWKGGPNQCDSTEPGNCGCLHAEENAIIKLNYNDPAVKRLYTTTLPCLACAKRIVNAGVYEVVFLNDYRKVEGARVLEKAGVKVTRLCPRDVYVKQDEEEGKV